MKKPHQRIIITVTIIFLVYSVILTVLYTNAVQENNKLKAELAALQPGSSDMVAGENVYASRADDKYHSIQSCNRMEDTIRLPRETAETIGLSPCEICY